MIKLFRNARLVQLKDGNVSRYIKYALGEIILVVIGILIAIQINSRYGKFAESKKEESYLISLNNDLDDQLQSIAIQKEYEKGFMDAGFRVLTNYAAKSEFEVDSTFFKSLFDMSSRKTFVRNDPTYTDLLSSGNIDIIKNVDLKHNLILFYQELERYENVIHNNNTILVDQQFIPLFLKTGFITDHFVDSVKLADLHTNGIQTFSMEPKDHLVKISKEILQKEGNELLVLNSINFRYNIALAHFTNLISLEKEIQQIMEEINNEISKN